MKPTRSAAVVQFKLGAGPGARPTDRTTPPRAGTRTRPYVEVNH